MRIYFVYAKSKRDSFRRQMSVSAWKFAKRSSKQTLRWALSSVRLLVSTKMKCHYFLVSPSTATNACPSSTTSSRSKSTTWGCASTAPSSSMASQLVRGMGATRSRSSVWHRDSPWWILCQLFTVSGSCNRSPMVLQSSQIESHLPLRRMSAAWSSHLRGVLKKAKSRLGRTHPWQRSSLVKPLPVRKS